MSNKLKSAIRARMRQTGEKYTTARAAILVERGDVDNDPKETGYPEDGGIKVKRGGWFS